MTNWININKEQYLALSSAVRKRYSHVLTTEVSRDKSTLTYLLEGIPALQSIIYSKYTTRYFINNHCKQAEELREEILC